MGSARRAIFAVFVGILAVCAAARGETLARIRQPIDTRDMTRLRVGVHPLARPEFDQGALDPSHIVHRIKLVFNRSAAQQQALEKLLEGQQDPKSPNYHSWLTPEQFAAQFGMSDADLAKVEDWLTSQGFTIDEVARGRNYIVFSGPVSDVNSAFRTELHQYNVHGEIHFANATPLALPTALAPVVAGIRSLNDFNPKPRLKRLGAKPDLTSSLTNSHFLAPDDFATIYNINALYAAGIDGTGQKLAVVGQTDLYSSGGDPAFDITTFRNDSNLPANPPQIINIPNAPAGLSANDISEASLDVEWAGAVARRATLIYVNAGSGAKNANVFDALYYAIDNNVAPVISISYGLCESSEFSSGFLSADETELQKAAAQGQTVVGPAGDSGAADCDSNYPITDALDVDYPASSAYVTGVGGTTFNETNGITFWNSVNDVYNGSALFYVPEMVWNDDSGTSGQISASGGGVSGHISQPTWQVGVVPSGSFRYVPDVAFAASPAHDGYIICEQGDCQICVTTDANCPTATSPGYRDASQNFDVVGGTSAGVPTFAGLIALLNQKTGSSQGNLNSKLYQLATNASYVFHDVTTGDNRVPCTSGPTCPMGGGSIGYSAAVGYDAVTGLGTPDGFNLVNNWNATASADFGVSFFNPSVYVAAGSSTNVLVTVRKQNGFSGMVSLTCSSSLPSVTCSVSPGTVSPDGTATVTIMASASAMSHPPLGPAPFVPWWATTFGVAALAGAGRPTRKKIVMVVLAVALLALVSCGGNALKSSTTWVVQSSTPVNVQNSTITTTAQDAPPAQVSAPSRPDRGSRPPQTYVTVQATSGNLTHSAQVLVSVN